MDNTLASFTDLLDDEICNSQPISLSSSIENETKWLEENTCNIRDTHTVTTVTRPSKGTGQRGQFRSIEEIDPKYRDVFAYPYFNLVQSKVFDDALYSDKSIVVCAPTGSGKTVVFEMAIVQLLMELDDKHYTEDFKIIYMAPVKALCTERLTEWYPKFTKLGLLCIEVTGDTDVDFAQLAPYKIIITTPEKWDMLTRRWRDHRSLVEVIKLFLIDEVHILNDETRGPVLEAVVSRMKTIESSAQSVHRIELLQNQLHGSAMTHKTAPSIRFVAVSATVSNPEDVANWLGTSNKPAVYHKFGDECRPVKLNKIVEGYPCPEGMSIFKFDIILNYKLWPIITKYHSGKPTLIFCNTRKSVTLTAETLSRELTINFNAEQKARLMALGSTIKNKKLQSLVMNGVGCHHAGLLYEERQNIERAFRNRDLPILITTTTLAMGVNLPAHLVIIKNTQQYVNGAFQEYSISTVLQMVGRAGRPQFDTEATAVIMTRHADKGRYQALVGGCEPLQSFLHKRLPENLNSEAALGTVGDVAQCVQWLRSTFLYVRAARDPKKYLGLPQNSPQHLISKKVEGYYLNDTINSCKPHYIPTKVKRLAMELNGNATYYLELCVKAMNGLASSGLITMDEASCIESTEAGRLMSVFYLDVETMKLLMKIEGSETLERLLILVCESHELSDMHLRMDERRCLNALNRNNTAATIRFPMKGKINTRQMKLNCIIQAVLGCLSIPDPSLNQEAMKIMRIADRVCKCLVAYVTRPDLISRQPEFYTAVLNSIILGKCIAAHLWENSPFVSKQLKRIGPTFSALLATAGKVNFILLEESHPRDLERIMNKSAPAGNVLRRQISLLPKYQLSMTPIDESTVMVQLDLLNQNFLSENMDQLTAGGSHKCYIIVGDSANHLLLLASFKDTDLIRVFDGTIKHEIRRRHNYEHKIFAHCISTTFVGVDVQSEFIFNNLGQLLGSSYTNPHQNETLSDETMKKQTCSDTLKKRKRKGSADLDKTQSKEKKKRENAIIQNFEYLKKTFEAASKNVKENMNLPIKKHLLPINDIVTIPEKEIAGGDEVTDDVSHDNETIDIDSDDFIDNDEKINNILTDIENEMFNRQIYSTNTYTSYSKQNDSQGASRYKHQGIRKMPNHSKFFDNKSLSATKRQKSLPVKSNYAFIDLLEKEIHLSDDDDQTVASNTNNGFSDTIKSHINKYIQKTESKSHMHDSNVRLFLENEDNSKSDRKQYSIVIADADGEGAASHKQYPHYEIKEILDKQNLTIETERSKKIECGPEKLVINSPSNTDSQSFTTLQNNDDLIFILKPTHNMKEGIQPYTDKNDSNHLCIEEENFQKSNIHLNTFKQNSDKAHVYSSDLQIETNDKITSLENELTTLRNNDTLKPSHGMKEGNQCYTKKNVLNILCTEKENFQKPKNHLCTFKHNSEKAHIGSSDFQIGTNDVITSLDNELPTLQKNEDLILTPKPKPSHGMKEVNQRYTNKIDSSNHSLNFEHKLEKDHVDSSDFQIEYNNQNKDKCSISNDRQLIELNCIHMMKISPEKTHTTESHNFHLSPVFDVDIKDPNETDFKKSIRMDTYNKEFNGDSYKNYDFKPRDALIINATSNTTSNLMFCANRSHFTNTSMLISNKEPTILSKLFRTNSYSQSSLINSNCLPHHSVNKNACIQNYSLTATEVDLQAKEMPKSCINVIKEIKIDMNISVSVTQILQNNIPESDNLQKPENVVHTDSSCDHFQNYLQDINNAVKCTEISIKKDLEKEDIQNKTIFRQLNSSIENKTLNEENNTKNDAVNYYNTNSKDLNTVLKEDVNSINDVNEINSSSLVDLEESTNLHEKTKEQKESDNERKTSEVQNILQKYSIILRNDTIKTSTGAVINKNIISNKSPTPKCKKPLDYIRQKKPFKISNITKLQTTLPEQLTNCYKHNVQQYTPISMEIVDNESISKKYTETESCLPLSSVDSEDECVPHPPLNDLDLVTDIAYCNIDQSMFDPKTLLQCSVNADSEEIIAPPSQFCDSDYNLRSPNYHDVEEPKTSDNYKPYAESQFIYSKNKDFNYQESIFEDHCPANLTPSREIETWTLAEQDCWENRYDSSLSPSSAKSFTVIRRCDSKRSELLGNKVMTNVSRQVKLRQFKFTDKKKLSKRK